MSDANQLQQSGDHLVEQCKNGDNAAFKKLYEQYAAAMFSISMRILNHEGEAEDVLQESFISAFKNINRFEGRSSFGAWLKRIVINNSINALKKRKINFIAIDTIEQAEEETEEEGVTYTIEAVKNAVQQLPDGYRTIITLYLFEDYTHRMIAEQLNISESTSKTQYLRARKRLAALIKQQNNG